MSFTVPWTPNVDGKALPPLGRLLPLLEDGLVPSSKTEPFWCKRSLDTLVVNVPEAKEPLREVLLALWRLKEVAPSDEEDPEDEAWELHVSVWLVSINTSAPVSLFNRMIASGETDLQVPLVGHSSGHHRFRQRGKDSG